MITDEQKVYIRGVKDHGNEVIEMLEKRGGKKYSGGGNDPECLYFIAHNGNISHLVLESECGKILMDNYRELKLGEWKYGDILSAIDYNDLFVIFNRNEPDGTFSVAWEVTENSYHVYPYPNGTICSCFRYRSATPSEIKRFHELLHKHHKDWDADKKRMVDWRWKPKEKELYYTIETNMGNIEIHARHCRLDDFTDLNFIKTGNYFKTKEEAKEAAERVKELFKGEL